MIIYVIRNQKVLTTFLILIFNELFKFKTSENGNIERRRALLWTVRTSDSSLRNHRDYIAFFTALHRVSAQKISVEWYLILRKLHRTREIFLKIILRPCKINLLM